jgi:hypothetical protein
MDMQGRQKAQQQQQQNLNNWYLYQALIRNQEFQRQAGFRNAADSSRLDTLNMDVSNIGQKAKQAAEADRLRGAYSQGTIAAAPSASDASIQAGTQQGALTGQSGGDAEFTSHLARSLNNAASSARDRIAALADFSSYGDSFKGLGTENPMAFARSAADINMNNNFRKGSLQAFGVEKQIQPQQVQYRGSPGAMGLNALGGLLGGMGKGGGGGGIF